MNPEAVSPARTAALVFFFAALFFHLTLPVADPDFWWHLAAGRWQWQHAALMRTDPFIPPAFAAEVSSTMPFATTQYWLSQLLFHGVFTVGGLTGVVLLRAGVFTLLWTLLYHLMRRSGAGPLLTASLTWLSVTAVVREIGYIGDRPQMWSSLLCVALVLVLEKMREGTPWAFAALAPLMLLWSNLHGGFLLGDLVIGIYLAAGLLTLRGGRRFTLACVIALAASGCNPNGFSIALSYGSVRLFGASTLLVAAEEQSLLRHGGLVGILRLMPYLTALALVGAAALLLNLRTLARRRPEHLALALLLIALGFVSIRFLVFFLTIGTWLTAASLSEAAARSPLLSHLRLPPSLAGAALPALALGVLLIGGADWARAAARSSSLRPSSAQRHPYEGVADFLVGSDTRGTIFNEYDAGGYLAWRLFPACRVFVYGGAPSPTALALFRSTIDAPTRAITPSKPGGYRFAYQHVLREHGVDVVVIPGCDPTSGTLIHLAAALAKDPEWAVVYADARALAFERITPANGSSLLRRMLPPNAVYDNIIGIARRVAQTKHGRSFPAWRYSLAFAHYSKGEQAQALPLLEDYLRLRPDDAASIEIRDRIVREIRAGYPRPTR